MPYNVEIIQKSPYGLLNLRGNEEVRTSFNQALGFELPVTPNTSTNKDNITAFWLGPDEWLIKTNDGDEISLAESLRNSSKDQHAAITALSDNYIIFEVSGSEARNILCQGSGIDLHPDQFNTGQCVRTSLSKMGVLLHQLKDTPSYDVYALRSYANYLKTWLNKAKGV